MAEIISINLEINYLHISFSGPYERLRKIDAHARKILEASNKRKCSNLLLDFSETSSLDEITTIEEHDLAEFIQKIITHEYRVAIVFPKLSNNPGVMIGKHLENVAVNRGAALRVFYQLSDAVSWIARTDNSSREEITDAQTKKSK